MEKIHGFEVREKIYESERSVVYKAGRIKDNRDVVIKLLKSNYPTPHQIARFKKEYEITNYINEPGVISILDFIEYKNTFAMIFDDISGKPLSKYIANSSFSIIDFLNLALSIIKSISVIHEKGVVHKDINPSNIIWHEQSNRIQIIDFGIANYNSKVINDIQENIHLEGTLPYISPEQTGRINRTIDYRSDYYSLGITFYEILTGEPPFKGADKLEMIYQHIATQPDELYKIKKDIPKVISKIVMKLLSKDAENRYQSAYGLLKDIQQCLEDYYKTGYIHDFEIGGFDISSTFILPGKIFGRDTELSILNKIFAKVCSGQKEIVFISGKEGIGKTSLAMELNKPVIQKHGFFLYGKCNKAKNDSPYRPLIDAFKPLIKQILSEPENKILKWKNKIESVLEGNAQLIINLIPELEIITGKQPQTSEISGIEQKNRFELTFKNFVGVFCSKETPVVLFIDDLQNADISVLNLIEILMLEGLIKHLMIIATLSPNENAERINEIKSNLKSHGLEINKIHLDELTIDDVKKMLSQTLNLSTFQVESLAEICLKKSTGNAFFLRQFMNSLYSNGAISFDMQEEKWQWNESEIKSVEIPDDIGLLMADKINVLNEDVKYFLKTASCLGKTFSIELFIKLTNLDGYKIYDLLEKSIDSGMINIFENQTPNADYVNALSQTNYYTFAHERIYEIIYSLNTEEEKKQAHYKIGKLLFEENKHYGYNEILFEIASHLNNATGLLKNEKEKADLIALNLKAGKKASETSAFDAAFGYFNQGISLLGQESWEKNYEITLELYTKITFAAFITGKKNEMIYFSSIVINNAKDIIDKIPVSETLMLDDISSGNQLKAIKRGVKILRFLGHKLPEKPSLLRVGLSVLKTKISLTGKSPKSFSKLKDMKDKKQLASFRIMMQLSSAAYRSAPEIIPILASKTIKLALKHGNPQDSAFIYMGWGLILCSLFGDIEKGYKYGQLSLEMLKKTGTPSLKPKVYTTVYCFISHWKIPLGKTINPLLEAYQSGMNIGDVEFSAYALEHWTYHAYLNGNYLPQLKKQLEEFRNKIAHLRQQASLYRFENGYQAIRNLIEIKDDPFTFQGEYFDEKDILPFFEKSLDQTLMFYFNFNKLLICNIYNEYEVGIKYGKKALKSILGVMGTIVVPVYFFNYSIALLRSISKENKKGKFSALLKSKFFLRRIKNWSKHVPENYLNKLYLLKAERARVKNKPLKAMKFYDLSIQYARENGFIHEQALACELAFLFYLETGKKELARYYLSEARYSYLKWGAEAKINQINEKYNALFHDLIPDIFFSENTIKTISSTTSTTTGSVNTLDLESIMKASQAISGEIILADLLNKLMQISIENAGAQNGLLIKEEDNRWIVLASAKAQAGEIEVDKNIISNKKKNFNFPVSIINYVSNTGKSVILEDASNSGDFTSDEYVLKKSPRSVMCVPLINQGTLTGIIYLENNLNKGVFTAQSLNFLKMLSSQIAVSLENSRMYKELEDFTVGLEQKVEERTRELSVAYDTIKKDLYMAKKVQTNFIESGNEEISNLDVSVYFKPMIEVGGDIYDISTVKDNYYRFFLADATGHGIQAALTTMIIKNEYDKIKTFDIPANDVLKILNGSFMMNYINLNVFFTCICVDIDISQNKLFLSSAGHPAQYLIKNSDIIQLKAKGKMIGILEESEYKLIKKDFNLTDKLILFTDGLFEEFTREDVELGEQGLVDIFKQGKSMKINQFVDFVTGKVNEWSEDKGVNDDITLIGIERQQNI